MNTYKQLFFNDKWKKSIKSGCEQFNIFPDNNQLDLFAIHAAHLYMWNKTINLTAITDPEEIAFKHFVDSIALIHYFKSRKADGLKIMDMGSGGGFPGFCLKVMNPQLDIVMIDSAKKKVNFLKDLIRTTGFDKIEAKHIRAEDLSDQDMYKNKFDFVVSRAFSNLNKFYSLSLPFLKKKGCILAMKGHDFEKEIKELNNLIVLNNSPMYVQLYPYSLPFQNIKRSIVQIS